jgi:CheY-like chemotaxis protein/anti-sigma regulatory factor (Ser/Thr protein kinase)
VLGDPLRLQQIVWNLLANAVKFTPTGGRVSVRLTSTDAALEIIVTDTGAGIPAHFLPHVFERFRQADSSSTRTHGGLGLGLAIVRHLAELHGGSVRAESPGEGQGSTFTVTLPVHKSPALVSPGTDTNGYADVPVADERGGHLVDTATPLTGLHVLVVDDDPDAREWLQVALTGAGARVRAVGSAGEALTAVALECPDLLVSDIAMPEVDGITLLRRLREQDGAAAGVPALALTAFASEHDQERIRVAGFLAHVAKPVDPEALVTAVVRLAGRSPAPEVDTAIG